jgi:hypothetical protein
MRRLNSPPRTANEACPKTSEAIIRRNPAAITPPSHSGRFQKGCHAPRSVQRAGVRGAGSRGRQDVEVLIHDTELQERLEQGGARRLRRTRPRTLPMIAFPDARSGFVHFLRLCGFTPAERRSPGNGSQGSVRSPPERSSDLPSAYPPTEDR